MSERHEMGLDNEHDRKRGCASDGYSKERDREAPTIGAADRDDGHRSKAGDKTGNVVGT